MGIYSCIGQDLETVLESLKSGRSGVGIDPAREEMGFRSYLTGILPKPDLTKRLDRRKRLSMSEEATYAYLATEEALKNAGIDEAFLNSREVGILYGNDSSAQAGIDGVDIIREKKNTTLDIKLRDIDRNVDFFYGWTGDEVTSEKTEALADRRAADKMKDLYAEIERVNQEHSCCDFVPSRRDDG